jgi:hypothetical protein
VRVEDVLGRGAGRASGVSACVVPREARAPDSSTGPGGVLDVGALKRGRRAVGLPPLVGDGFVNVADAVAGGVCTRTTGPVASPVTAMTLAVPSVRPSAGVVSGGEADSKPTKSLVGARGTSPPNLIETRDLASCSVLENVLAGSTAPVGSPAVGAVASLVATALLGTDAAPIDGATPGVVSAVAGLISASPFASSAAGHVQVQAQFQSQVSGVPLAVVVDSVLSEPHRSNVHIQAQVPSACVVVDGTPWLGLPERVVPEAGWPPEPEDAPSSRPAGPLGSSVPAQSQFQTHSQCHSRDAGSPALAEVESAISEQLLARVQVQSHGAGFD